MTANPPENVVWDVIEEHFDEIAYSLEQFDDSLESCTKTLDELARYPEERLLAHVDALVVAGERARERVLLPALSEEDAEPARSAAAALVLTTAGHHDDLLVGLGNADPLVRAATARGAELASAAALDAWLAAQLRKLSSRDVTLRCGLLELAARRRVITPSLTDALQSDDEELVLVAVRAAECGETSLYLAMTEDLIQSGSERVQEAAMITCMRWGSRYAFSLAEKRALEHPQPSRQLLSLVAALGGAEQWERLAARLDDARLRPLLLFALGFTGAPAAIPVLLDHVASKEPLEARVAMQSLALLTGFDLRSEAYSADPARTPAPPESGESIASNEDPPDEADEALPLLEDDDLDADLVPLPEQALASPRALAIRIFCEPFTTRPARERLLCGRPYDLLAMTDALTSLPLRCRHLLARTFEIRAGGQAWLDTRAFTRRQRAGLSVLRAAPPRILGPTFGKW